VAAAPRVGIHWRGTSWGT